MAISFEVPDRLFRRLDLVRFQLEMHSVHRLNRVDSKFHRYSFLRTTNDFISKTRETKKYSFPLPSTSRMIFNGSERTFS